MLTNTETKNVVWFYTNEVSFGSSGLAPSISSKPKERTGLEIRKVTSAHLSKAARETGYKKWFIGWAAIHWGLLLPEYRDRWNAPADRTDALMLNWDRSITKPVWERTNLQLPQNDNSWKSAVEAAYSRYMMHKWQIVEACIYGFLSSEDIHNIQIRPSQIPL